MEKRRIRVKDLAPLASIEDLSDESENPLEGYKPKTLLANIEEGTKMSKVSTASTGSTSGTTNNSPAAKMNLNVTSTTPRIDISRASSSSHQEDSSPERELILGKAKDLKLEVFFGEEIASELHKSTEELSFHENGDAEKNCLRMLSSHVVLLTDMQREDLLKDSGCSSDLAFPPISGRRSRVSSVGSVASGSSDVSNISAMSGVSNPSRDSSPHRTTIETSFCSKKLAHNASINEEYPVIVSKQTGSSSISTNTQSNNNHTGDQLRVPKQQKSQCAYKNCSKLGHKESNIQNPKTQKFVSLHSDKKDKSVAADTSYSRMEAVATQLQQKPGVGKTLPGLKPRTQVNLPATQLQPKPGAGKTLPGLDPRTQVYIPLRGDSIEERMAATSTCSKKEIGTSGKQNLFSFKRMKPFTNSILLNFISKYDTLKDSPTVTTSPAPQRKIYEEFQKFIRLRDDDDPSIGGGGSKNSHQSNVDHMQLPVQVHRSRSFSDNITCATVVEDGAQVSKLDTRIPAPMSPMLPVNPQQSSLCLSDSQLEQCHCDSRDSKMDRCYSSMVTITSSSFSFSSSVDPSHQSSSQFLQPHYRGTRQAKSMSHLTSSTKNNSSDQPSINVCTASNTTSISAGSDEYPIPRCSESAEEMRNLDKMKSRSGSIKSLLRTFFKKNGDMKTEKTYHIDSAAKIESKPIQSPQKSRTSSTAESLIIPLHSPDYDYEAAATISKTASVDDDKKDRMTTKTVAVIDPYHKEGKELPDLPSKQVVDQTLIHQGSRAETNLRTETSIVLNTSERIEFIAKTTMIQCHVPSSSITSSCM